jgi:hypothetical protein
MGAGKAHFALVINHEYKKCRTPPVNCIYHSKFIIHQSSLPSADGIFCTGATKRCKRTACGRELTKVLMNNEVGLCPNE